MEAGGTPVVFVHGLWLHADSWGPWVDAFDESGYSARAVGWPGDAATVDETRADPDRVAGHGIAESLHTTHTKSASLTGSRSSSAIPSAA